MATATANRTTDIPSRVAYFTVTVEADDYDKAERRVGAYLYGGAVVMGSEAAPDDHTGCGKITVLARREFYGQITADVVERLLEAQRDRFLSGMLRMDRVKVMEPITFRLRG